MIWALETLLIIILCYYHCHCDFDCYSSFSSSYYISSNSAL